MSVLFAASTMAAMFASLGPSGVAGARLRAHAGSETQSRMATARGRMKRDMRWSLPEGVVEQYDGPSGISTRRLGATPQRLRECDFERLELPLCDVRRRDELRLRGTFAPFTRASDNPIAMACLRLFARPCFPAPLFSTLDLLA